MVFLLPALLVFSRAIADTTIVIIDICFISYCISNKDWAWLKKPWVRVILALWLYTVFIVSPLAIDPTTSFKPALLFVRYIVFGVAFAYWVLENDEMRKNFQLGIIFVIAFITLDTFYQYFNGTDVFGIISTNKNQLNGPFHDQVAGTFTSRIIFIAIATLFFSTITRKIQLKALIILFSMGIVMLLIFITGERTAFLNYLLGCFIVLSSLFFMYSQLRPWLIAGVLLIGGGISVVVIQNPSIKERTIDSCYGYIANWPESGNGRCVRASLRVWTDHNNYATGIGLRNTRFVLSKPRSDSLRKEYGVSKGSHSHNIYIGWLVGAGVIGLGGFLCFVGLLFVEIARYTLPNRYYMQTIFAFVVLLATFFPLNHGMSFFTNHHAPIIWLTIGWALAYTRSFANAPPNSVELH